MSHPCIHHCHRLVCRAGAGSRAAAPRRGGLVDGHDWRGAPPHLDRRLGPAGARRDLTPCHLRRRAGKSVAICGVLRPRASTWLAAWSPSVAFVSVSRPLGFLLSPAMGPALTSLVFLLDSGTGRATKSEDCTLLSRFSPRAGFVTLRQTFVRRSIQTFVRRSMVAPLPGFQG
jgi:hypothetical protein